jgi:hypothetical protein
VLTLRNTEWRKAVESDPKWDWKRELAKFRRIREADARMCAQTSIDID